MKHRKTFLGIGWKFPPTFDKNINSVQMVSEEYDIRESLFIILSTKPGERVMDPTFGCGIHFMQFEPINVAGIAKMRLLVEEAIIRFEPRVDVNKVNVNVRGQLDGIVWIEVDYTVKATNTRNNIVYPYYLIEGTEVNL
ncbi:MAG: GPW/gp25 family protein [Thermonemataceae bacterium]